MIIKNWVHQPVHPILFLQASSRFNPYAKEIFKSILKNANTHAIYRYKNEYFAKYLQICWFYRTILDYLQYFCSQN